MNAEVSEENKRMKGIEMFILGICTLYIIGIVFLIHQSGWSEWFLFFVYFGAFAVWLQYLTKTDPSVSTSSWKDIKVPGNISDDIFTADVNYLFCF